MTTVRQILTNAMQLIAVNQVGENPSAADMAAAQSALNNMIESWGTDSLNIHKRTPYTFNLMPSQGSYTLGPAVDDSGSLTGADWVVERPLRIERANLILRPNT